jgi:hypothetical protein
MRRLRHYAGGLLGTLDHGRLICHVRGKPIADTLEERVRQDVLRTLTDEYGYPEAALFPEEPIARGTPDRRRADVLVELPEAIVLRHDPLIHEPGTSPALSYPRAAREVREQLGEIEEVFVVDLPEEVNLVVDGERVRAQVYGFRERRGGIALELTVSPREIQRLSMPERISPLVLGLGLLESENALAQQLGLPSNWAFDSSANLRFLESAMDRLHVRGLCPRFNRVVEYDEGFTSGVSLDGRSGWLVVRTGGCGPGVLVRLNSMTLKGPEPQLVGMIQRSRKRSDAETLRRRVSGVDGPSRTLIVVECKAPGVSLSEEVRVQGRGYAEQQGARYLVLTSGTAGRTEVYVRMENEWIPIREDIPTYEQLSSQPQFGVARVPSPAPRRILPEDAESRPGTVWLHARARDCIGLDLPRAIWCAVLRIDDALTDPSFSCEEALAALGISVTDDRGLKLHEPGHSAGRLPSLFRDFVVRDRGGHETCVSLAVRGLRAVRGHSRWCNQASGSRLLVSIPVASQYRNDLELNLESSCRPGASGGFEYFHLGKMSKGNGGAYSPREVLAWTRDRFVELMRGEEVFLGLVPPGGTTSRAELAQFVARALAYGLARRDFKIFRREEGVG